MQEQLLGHLLGALDDDEQRVLDERLEHDHECCRQLVQWRRRLSPIERARPDFEPRPGLADRTCRLVAAYAAASADAGAAKQRMTPFPTPPCRTTDMGWSDFTALTLLLLLSATIVLPAVYGSRFQARVASCQNELRHFGTALAQYGGYQRIPLAEFAHRGGLSNTGLEAASHIKDTYVSGGLGAAWPEAWLAAQTAQRRQLALALPEASLQNTGTSNKNWPGVGRTGMTDDRRYPPSPADLPLLADAPSADTPDQFLASHGGLGRNVYFANGRTEFLPTPANLRSDEPMAAVLTASLK